jgi:hypothetical protein
MVRELDNRLGVAPQLRADGIGGDFKLPRVRQVEIRA